MVDDDDNDDNDNDDYDYDNKDDYENKDDGNDNDDDQGDSATEAAFHVQLQASQCRTLPQVFLECHYRNHHQQSTPSRSEYRYMHIVKSQTSGLCSRLVRL